MKILITEPNRFIVESKQAPEVGQYYTLEDYQSGTNAQLRAFHSLVKVFWDWLFKTDSFVFENNNTVCDLSTTDWHELKEKIKYKYGAGYKYLQYVNDKNQMEKADSIESVPDYVLLDFNNGNHKRIKAVLKSLADYTKKERQNIISNLISLIAMSGCDDKKIFEIIEGMENVSNTSTKV